MSTISHESRSPSVVGSIFSGVTSDLTDLAAVAEICSAHSAKLPCRLCATTQLSDFNSANVPNLSSWTRLNCILQTVRCIVFIILLSNFQFQTVMASPLRFNFGERSTLQTEIQCYSLPYGGIGFLSHVLTYWTLYCLWFSRRPLGPCRPLKGNSRADVVIGVTTLIGCVSLAIVTMSRCRNRWQFVLIAFSKLCLSLTCGITTLHASHNCERYDVDKHFDQNFAWVAIHVLGLIIGFVGLGSLVKQSTHAIPVITYVFVILVVGIVLLAIILLCRCDIDNYGHFLAWTGVAIVASICFYSDWILGGIAGDFSGVPSSDTVIYWLYFAIKRLPMLIVNWAPSN